MPGLKVGFLGIGRMGSGMAKNLLKAGYRLVVCDPNTANVNDLATRGAEVAETPAELGSMPGMHV